MSPRFQYFKSKKEKNACLDAIRYYIFFIQKLYDKGKIDLDGYLIQYQKLMLWFEVALNKQVKVKEK